MTEKIVTKFGLLMGQAVISDAIIDQMERAGGVTFNYMAREILQGLARDYVLHWLDRPPTKKEAQKIATLRKRILKSQKKRNKKIARACLQAADLLQEELEDPISETGLAYRLFMNDQESGTPLEDAMLLPRLEAHNRALAEFASQELTSSETETNNAPTKDKRRKSGLNRKDGHNRLIAGFAYLYVLVGGEIANTTDTISEKGERKSGPFHEAAKVLIDALPGDCPKLRLTEILHRVYDNNLADGLTKGRARHRELKPSALLEIVLEHADRRIAVRKTFGSAQKG